MTGTPTTISEQPRTSVNVKPLEKPQEGYPGTPANIVLRIPPFGTVSLSTTHWCLLRMRGNIPHGGAV